MNLNQIRDNEGATKNRKRVARGIGSGKGKTGGRGVKGQKSRSGVSLLGFEGGQMPLYRRLPKRGFNNIFRKTFAQVNLSDLQKAVDSGKLDAKATVNLDSLKASGVLKGAFDGLRVLGRGELKAKLSIEADGATKSAQAAIEKAGGKIAIAEVKAPVRKLPAKNKKS